VDELFPVFAAIATAITVEAMPFLALGAQRREVLHEPRGLPSPALRGADSRR